MIQRIAILGVGLIGGSLALAWKRARTDLVLIGYDRPDILDEALNRALIDEKAASVEDAVQDADVVVLATPLGAIPHLLEQIAPHLKPGTVVTDVGSVKQPTVAHAHSVLRPSNPFIGGHPMAGKEHSGVAYADALLFENATYVLCPQPGFDTDTFANAFPHFIELIQQTGARVLVLDPERHDRIAATVSHVPQLVAVALMNLAARSDEDDGAFLRMGAGGFRDMTRIASSPFGMWGDILDANHEAVAAALNQLIEILRSQQQNLRRVSSTRLAEDFETARAVRRTIPKDMKGFLRPLADVYVYAVDKPGFLAHLTQTLYDAGLNIKDLELLKIREGTGGTFRVSFADGTDADRGVETLNANGYTAYRL